MPVRWEVSGGGGRTGVLATGAVDGVELVAAHRAHLDEIGPEGADAVLLDWRQLSGEGIDSSSIRTVAELLGRLGEQNGRIGRLAIVAHDDLVFGLGRMVEAYVGPLWDVLVTRDGAEAEAWLAGEPGS